MEIKENFNVKKKPKTNTDHVIWQSTIKTEMKVTRSSCLFSFLIKTMIM